MHWDCHMHMVLDGVDWKAAIARHAGGPDIPWIRQQLEIYRQQGCTYLRDGGDRWGVGAAARELASEYGITYRTPLAPLCHRGHYGGFIGRSFENLEEYRALVVEQKKNGADFVKIMISGLMDFDRYGVLTQESLPAEEIGELIRIAHGEGMAVMAHANGVSALAAARAGVDSVEHGAYLNVETLEVMAEKGCVWVPTLSTIGNLRGKGRFSEKDVEKILESALENVKAFHRMGGLLAPGSDAGAWAVPHGSKTEYEYFRMALGPEAEDAWMRGAEAIQRKF